jgi:hypothetical protein
MLPCGSTVRGGGGQCPPYAARARTRARCRTRNDPKSSRWLRVGPHMRSTVGWAPSTNAKNCGLSGVPRHHDDQHRKGQQNHQHSRPRAKM